MASRPDVASWRKMQAVVFARQNGKCWKCGVQMATERNGHCDHVRPLASGGTSELSNLRYLCQKCHALRRNRRHDAFRQHYIKKGLLPDWRKEAWDYDDYRTPLPVEACCATMN